LLAYNFGPARLLMYATDEIYARDTTQGRKISANLSFPRWDPRPHP